MRTLHIHGRADQGVTAHAMLLLAYDARQKSRFRSKLPDGREVVVMLPRGQTLRDGDALLSDEGVVGEIGIRVRNAVEFLGLAR